MGWDFRVWLLAVLREWPFQQNLTILGSLRNHDGNGNGNVAEQKN